MESIKVPPNAPLSLAEEEMLADKVKQFPVLYDKTVKGYKYGDFVANAWEEVAKELAFVENGSKAQSLFITLKKKYQRKRKDLKDAHKSGALDERLIRAQRAFKPYEFLQWIDDFVQTRQGRKNRKAKMLKANDLQHGDSTITSPLVLSQINDEDNTTKVPADVSKRPESKCDTTRKNSLEEMIKSVKQRKLDPESKEDLFCKSLAADLKDLPQYERCLATHDIRNVIFKYQMAAINKQQSQGQQNQTYQQHQDTTIKPML